MAKGGAQRRGATPAQDEESSDPESLIDWRVAYDIELA